MALVSHCHLQDQKALSSANWIFRARQNYNVTFSVWGSEPSNPADGSVPPEPSDSLATSMFWVNFFGLFYEQNSGNCFADFWWIFDARQNYNVTFSVRGSEPSEPDFFVVFWSQTKLWFYIQSVRLRAFRSCGWQRATGAIGFLCNFNVSIFWLIWLVM